MRVSEFSRGWKPTALAAAAVLIAGASASSATPLDVLEGTSQSLGGLTFHFTKVEEVGGIVLQDVDLTLVSDGLGVGFDVTPLVAGALLASNGALKDLKLRIASVKSTQKITKAMQLVAAAKLKRTQDAAEAARGVVFREDRGRRLIGRVHETAEQSPGRGLAERAVAASSAGEG